MLAVSRKCPAVDADEKSACAPFTLVMGKKNMHNGSKSSIEKKSVQILSVLRQQRKIPRTTKIRQRPRYPKIFRTSRSALRSVVSSEKTAVSSNAQTQSRTATISLTSVRTNTNMPAPLATNVSSVRKQKKSGVATKSRFLTATNLLRLRYRKAKEASVIGKNSKDVVSAGTDHSQKETEPFMAVHTTPT